MGRISAICSGIVVAVMVAVMTAWGMLAIYYSDILNETLRACCAGLFGLAPSADSSCCQSGAARVPVFLHCLPSLPSGGLQLNHQITATGRQMLPYFRMRRCRATWSRFTTSATSTTGPRQTLTHAITFTHKLYALGLWEWMICAVERLRRKISF